MLTCIRGERIKTPHRRILDNMKIKELIKELENQKPRSKWDKGVVNYSIMILEKIQDDHDHINGDISFQELETLLLNGAENWSRYSWGGNALINNEDIARMLSTPSELTKNNNGEKRPNRKEEWLDTQARALTQAFYKIWGIVKSASL